MSYYGRWAPYVPVARRRSRALSKIAQLRKKGMDIQPITIEGRKITTTFWGQAWCDHLESLGDFENRLPRGRTYVRNGSVCHLAIDKGQIKAMVSGSSLYDVQIKIDVLPEEKWTKVKSRCAGQIGSLLELLQGRLSEEVMGVVTDSKSGLFPLSKEIRLSCSCPDYAVMCKHVAAVLYGVGARLDRDPALLFLLRGVKQDELIRANAQEAVNRATRRGGRRPTLASGELGEVFGIELASEQDSHSSNHTLSKRSESAGLAPRKKKATGTSHPKKSRVAKKTASKSVTKKSTKKKATKKRIAKQTSAEKNTIRKTKPARKTAVASAKKKAAAKQPTTVSGKKSAGKTTKRKSAPTGTSK